MNNSTQNTQEDLARLDRIIEENRRIRDVLLEEQKPIVSVIKWIAPERTFQVKDRRWYVIVAVIAMIIIVLAALTENFLLIFVVIGMLFITYALNTIPPKKITHEITNRGLHTFSELIVWNRLQAFWLTKRQDEIMIHFIIKDNAEAIPRKLIILLGDGNIVKITSYLVQFIDYWSAQEAGAGLIQHFLDGEYQPLIKFIESDNIKTKDPIDAPVIQKTDTTNP
ncbi:MAG: hypothetical protein WCJ58_04595 [bacterium]